MLRTISLITFLVAGLCTGDAAFAQDAPRPRRQVEIRRAAPGWIGVSFVTVAPPSTGVVVEDVIADAPAERAGVMPGDTIVQWNGRTDVVAAMRATSLDPGDTVTIRIRRGNERDRDLTMVAERRPASLVASDAAERLREALTEMSRGLEMQSDRLGIRIDSVRSRLDDRFFFRFDSLAADLDSLRVRLPDAWRGRGFPGDSIFDTLDSLRVRGFRVPEFDRDLVETRAALLESMLSQQDFIESIRADSFGPMMALRVTRSRDALAGAQVTSLNPGLASYFGVESGVLVLRVLPQTPAATAGLREGDVIVEAAGTPVADVVELRRQMSGARNGMELEIVRQRQRQTIILGR